MFSLGRKRISYLLLEDTPHTEPLMEVGTWNTSNAEDLNRVHPFSSSYISSSFKFALKSYKLTLTRIIVLYCIKGSENPAFLPTINTGETAVLLVFLLLLFKQTLIYWYGNRQETCTEPLQSAKVK